MKYKPELIDLVKDINTKARLIIECDFDTKVPLNNTVVYEMANSAFWASAKGKVYIMKNDHSLGDYAVKDAQVFMLKTFGEIFDGKLLRELVSKHGGAENTGKKVKAVQDAAWTEVLNYIKYNNLRNSIEMRVDMFSDVGRVSMLDEAVQVVYPHLPFTVPMKTPDSAIIADYKEHFPLLDSILDLIIAARFARDRKRAYLWLRCDTDWGKGFFMALLSKNLKLAVEMSVKEIEGIFEGRPAGKSMVDFKRAMILVVDEFKSARSEIKQLQNTISLSPKHQLSQSVEVFTKIFMSAEDVPSFASADGIEDQFANRFSYASLSGSLAERPMFKSAGRAAYFDNCEVYVSDYLNSKIEEYVGLGRSEAEKKADDAVDAFYYENRISNTFDTFSSNMGSFSERFLDWLVENRLQAEKRKGFRYDSTYSESDKDYFEKLLKTDEGWFIKSPAKFVAKWITEEFDKSIAGSLMMKKTQIVNASVKPLLNNRQVCKRVGGVKHNGMFLCLSDEQAKRLNKDIDDGFNDINDVVFPDAVVSTTQLAGAALIARRDELDLPADGSEDDFIKLMS